MASLFDVFGRLLLDDGQFQTDVAKSADKAGLTVGKRMGAALQGQGAKALFGGIAGGAAIATKGMLELDSATAKFAADTGATADEAKRAGEAINDMAGHNLQSVAEVGDALAKVHTDLGLTGEAAEQTTEQFLKFATATGQDASDAVLAFDDILDNWNLTADDAQGLMDKLIVSHQKFGGSISDNQKTLAKLAPAMQAANFEIDDGIGLLGLFGAKGLDSERAAAAFSKALTKVKSPEELKGLIADIQATEDPFLRAQKAADLFGAKAGAQLANALGGANLDDYAISVEEAAGATDRAADTIEGAFGNRVKLALKQATAALTGFGSNFGPALTGLASLASLGGALGGGALVRGISGLAGKVGGAILQTAAGGVAKKAWTAAGDRAATLYLKSLLAGDALSKGLSGAVSKAAGSSLVTGALDKAGQLWGSRLGTAMKGALLLAMGAVIVDLLQQLDRQNAQNAQASHDIGTSIGEEITSGTLEALKQSRGAVAEGLRQMDSALGPLGGFSQARQDLADQLERIDAAIVARAHDTDAAAKRAAESMGGAVAGFAEDVTDAKKSVGKSFGAVKQSVGSMAAKVVLAAAEMSSKLQVSAKDIASALHTLTGKLLGEATALIDGYYDPLIAQQELQVQKAEVAADKIALAEAKKAAAATKAGTTQRREADATVASAQLAATQSQKALDTMRVNLLASGQLSAREQKEWLADLQARYKTATGTARTDLGLLIAKVHELQNARATVTVNVNTQAASRALQALINQTRVLANRQVNFGVSGGHLAAGGPALPGLVYEVGEKGRELFAPTVPGVVIPHGLTEAMLRGQGGAGATTVNLTVNPSGDMSQLAARRAGQTILDVVANGLREQRARQGTNL